MCEGSEGYGWSFGMAEQSVDGSVSTYLYGCGCYLSQGSRLIMVRGQGL